LKINDKKDVLHPKFGKKRVEGFSHDQMVNGGFALVAAQ